MAASYYSNVVLNTAGLVSYYRLNESSGTAAADSKGSNTGTYNTGFTLSQSSLLFGDSDTSVLLDGANGVVDCGNPAAFQLTTGSLEAWVKSSDTTAIYRAIVVKPSAYGMFYSGGTTNFGYFDWTAATYHDSGTDVSDGKRHHCVLTFSPSTASLYLDGINKISSAVMTPQSQTNNLYVGANTVGGGQNLNGTFDEVAVYNVALSQTTISQHYIAGTSLPQPFRQSFQAVQRGSVR